MFLQVFLFFTYVHLYEPVCVYVTPTYKKGCREQKRKSDTLELELQAVVRKHGEAENGAQVLCKRSKHS